jgi:hypothetical protein
MVSCKYLEEIYFGSHYGEYAVIVHFMIYHYMLHISRGDKP